jgi:hypothetical protein
MTDRTVPLTNPIKGHAGFIESVTLREPTGDEYFSLGEPGVYARTAERVTLQVENDPVIKAYIEKCVVAPANALLLAQLSLVDAMKVKDAMLGFFQDARLASSKSAPKS